VNPVPTPAGPAVIAGEYRAARSGAILADRDDRGVLLFSGRDAADLLHRLTTNALRDLRPGEGLPAVFATPKGRILDLVLFHALEEGLLAITGSGRAGAIAAWVERYTFREQIRVEDRSASHGIVGLFGARAAAIAGRRFGPEAERLPPHHVLRRAAAGGPVLVAATFPLAGGGYHLVAERPRLEGLRRELLATGGVTPAGPACLEILRIEAGLPEPGAELTERHNPWEARLDDAISLDKGCYVGQEVIARLHTYKKVAQVLVRLRIAGPPPPPGAALLAGDTPTGTLTSAAAVPGEERAVALGYVRDEDAVAGRQVAVAAPQGGVTAVIEGPAR
jgi:folate-binding protein YgfZ